MRPRAPKPRLGYQHCWLLWGITRTPPPPHDITKITCAGAAPPPPPRDYSSKRIERETLPKHLLMSLIETCIIMELPTFSVLQSFQRCVQHKVCTLGYSMWETTLLPHPGSP